MSGEDRKRIDGRLKVTGGATYSAEWDVKNLAHGVLVQSTIPSGAITALDIREASAVPGVITILTADNAPKLPKNGRAAVAPPHGRMLSLLQERAVRYNGEPIGVVVAETLEAATHAALLVRVTYREEKALVRMEEGLPTAELYTQEVLGEQPSSKRGDATTALRSAPVKVEQTYTTPLETHSAMEPHATIAIWEGDALTLYDSTQYVYGCARTVAKTFELPPDKVRVVSKFAGGAFGSKGSAWSHVILAAMAAKVVQRPVKIVLTRRQMFGLVGARPYTSQYLAIGAKKDGALAAINQVVSSSTSTFEDWVETATMQTRMLYAAPNVETSQKLVRMNIGTPTFNRGPGESSGTFALESALDELAEKLAIDPLALRLKNYTEKDPDNGLPFSSKSLRECYQRGAEKFGWSKRGKPRARRDGKWLTGMGMSTATYPMKRQPAHATATLMTDGSILVRAATHELGCGTYTSMSQIAAEAAGVPVERIRFELGDTRLPENPISAGSMTASSTGPAVAAAAAALADLVSKTGGSLAGDWRAALAANGGQTIEAEGHAAQGEEKKKYSMHSFGAVFVEVRVDAELGIVRVSRVLGAYAAGRILNPRLAKSQFQGGIIYGLSMALHEHTLIDPRNGRYVNADLAEYHLPVNADIPEIEVLMIDERDPHVNPLGVKGIGEIGTTGVAAAVANAVYNATGVRVRDLPITLDKLLGV